MIPDSWLSVLEALGTDDVMYERLLSDSELERNAVIVDRFYEGFCDRGHVHYYLKLLGFSPKKGWVRFWIEAGTQPAPLTYEYRGNEFQNLTMLSDMDSMWVGRN